MLVDTRHCVTPGRVHSGIADSVPHSPCWQSRRANYFDSKTTKEIPHVMRIGTQPLNMLRKSSCLACTRYSTAMQCYVPFCRSRLFSLKEQRLVSSHPMSGAKDEPNFPPPTCGFGLRKDGESWPASAAVGKFATAHDAF